MSDSYRQFCEKITDLTAEEEAWLRLALERETKENSEICARFTDEYDQKNFPNFQWTVYGQEREIHLHAEENFDANHVVALVQAFFKRFRPTGSLCVSYSETCSRLYTSQFGGGAFFVTANHVEYLDTAQWLGKLEKKFLQGLERQRRFRATRRR